MLFHTSSNLAVSEILNIGSVCNIWPAWFVAGSGVEYRLAGGPTPDQGRVEMALEGVWGTVCDAVWDDDDAKVRSTTNTCNLRAELYAS